MFLYELSNKHKCYFLELAYLLANSDNDFDKKEKQLIEVYRAEMHLTEETYTIQGIAVDEILQGLKDVPENQQNKIIFELIALALADNDYSSDEKVIIAKLRELFGISIETENKLEQATMDLMSTYANLHSILATPN